jgi:ABC-2 type transport system permease protein
MRTAFVIAAKELRLRFRDRSAIVFAFIAPLALALIISFAFRGDQGFETTFTAANLDDGELGKTFVSAVKQGLGDAVTMKEAESFGEAREMLDKGEAFSAFLIPEGFSSAVQNGQPAEIKVLRNADAPISGEVAEAFAEGFVTEINAGRLALATAVQAGALEKPDSQGLPSLIQKSVAERIPIQLIQGKIGGTAVNSASYFGPAMAIFFLSFTVQFGTIGILTERREGTLARMFAAPISATSILGGKVLGAFVLGMVSLFVMNAATSLMLGATWGPTVGVLLLGAGAIFAFMGVSAIGATFARTEESAQGFVGIVMSLFALLGGNFIPINEAPALVQRLSLATPNGWAMRGFIDLSTGGDLGSLVTPMIALGLIGTVTFSIGAVRGRGMLVQ